MGYQEDRQTILIVGDAPEQLLLLGKFLESFDFEVKFFDKGHSALLYLHRYGAELILLAMDSTGFCEIVKKDEKLKGISVVFLAARNDEDALVDCFCKGAADYISKPYGLKEVLARICVLLEHDLKYYLKSGDLKNETSSPQLTVKVREYIACNFHESITLDDIARHANISTSRLSCLFKTQTGETCIHYLTRVRISEACRLLQESGAMVTEVAYEVGFNDSNYFSVVFKRTVGISPSIYRRNQ